jgi:hypothetical protein
MYIDPNGYGHSEGGTVKRKDSLREINLMRHSYGK